LSLEDWFLTPEERGNAGTTIDRRRDDGCAWTLGNHVEVHVDGACYFARLHAVLSSLERGDSVQFTDWQGDRDELLAGPGTEVGRVLIDAVRRGVGVYGLIWRSHPRLAHFAEKDNTNLARSVNRAGGELVLDERVRRGGSHHQKIVVVRSRAPSGSTAFVGGIDLCHGRHDDSTHRGDPQAIALDPRYGARPPWHDVQLELAGPAVADVDFTFRERWEDPTPLDHRNPWRLLMRRLTHQPRRPGPLPAASIESPECGDHAVQVIRTDPAKRPSYPFAPEGERSVARAYLKAFRRARGLVYVEDQYLWSARAARALADALIREPDLRVVAVVPRHPDRAGRISGAANRVGRERFMQIVGRAGGDRFAVYDLENVDGTPIYVHAKVCVVDDVLLVVGSDNLNRRSWTHDSEVSCAVIDAQPDERAPTDPGGRGEGARRLARDTRLRLWREHLGRADGDDADLVDPVAGFTALSEGAAALDDWYRGGRRGLRPPGHLRRHDPDRVGRGGKWPATVLYRVLLDPDGRPRALRGRDAF
jgi:phosphatidylserine/phosphatidylglycerophosphate/cardiolipin synthase-like enzyme